VCVLVVCCVFCVLFCRELPGNRIECVLEVCFLERVRVKCGELNEFLKGFVRVVSHEFEVVRRYEEAF